MVEDLNYTEILEVLVTNLRDIGEFDIADKNNYLIFDEDNEPRLPNDKTLITEMLNAFDRKLSIEDKTNYYKAIDRINRVLKKGNVRATTIEEVIVSDEFNEYKFSSEQMIDLSEIRDEVNKLLEKLNSNNPTPQRNNTRKMGR